MLFWIFIKVSQFWPYAAMPRPVAWASCINDRPTDSLTNVKRDRGPLVVGSSLRVRVGLRWCVVCVFRVVRLVRCVQLC
jgi:hypothetical protein